MEKKCSKCEEAKSLSMFYKDKKNRDGHQSHCKQCKIEWLAQYYKTPEGKKKHRKHQKTWETKNRDKVNAKQLRNYYRNRISWNISRLIRASLGRDKNGAHWELVVDFTLEELRNHLKSQFQDGMSWDNYGEWHIDHIRPISSFQIADIHCQGFRDCWSLSNLQPLWAIENLKKSNALVE